MADPNLMLELPRGDLSGAMHQPLLPWSLWYWPSKYRPNSPWYWEYRRMFLTNTEACTKIRDHCKIAVSRRLLGAWQRARNVWFPPAGTAAWGYVRVSHDSSAASGLSVEMQCEYIRKYHEDRFAQNGVELGPILSDSDTSARFVPMRGRKGGRDLLGLTKPGDHILFVTLDRGFRSMKDAMVMWEDEWEPKNITPHFIQFGIDVSSVEGMMMFQACLMMAQAESSWKQRTSLDRAAHFRRTGRPSCGNARYGFKIIVERGVKRVVPDQEQRDLMARMEKMHKGEGWSCRRIAAWLPGWLDEHPPSAGNPKYPSPLHSPWSRQKVQRMLAAWRKLQG